MLLRTLALLTKLVENLPISTIDVKDLVYVNWAYIMKGKQRPKLTIVTRAIYLFCFGLVWFGSAERLPPQALPRDSVSPI